MTHLQRPLLGLGMSYSTPRGEAPAQLPQECDAALGYRQALAVPDFEVASVAISANAGKSCGNAAMIARMSS